MLEDFIFVPESMSPKVIKIILSIIVFVLIVAMVGKINHKEIDPVYPPDSFPGQTIIKFR